MKAPRTLVGLLMLGGVAVAGPYPRAQTTMVPVEGRGMQKSLSDIVGVRDVHLSGQTLRCRVVNRSDTPIGDVRLELDHRFLWDDEQNPGFDDPSRRENVVVARAIAPGESVTFQHHLHAPLPERNDGTFLTKVEAVGVTQMPAGAAVTY